MIPEVHGSSRSRVCFRGLQGGCCWRLPQWQQASPGDERKSLAGGRDSLDAVILQQAKKRAVKK